MYVYRKSNEPGGPLFTVGFYGPTGDWNPETDHDDQGAAANRVHWLNGGRKEWNVEWNVEASKNFNALVINKIEDLLKKIEKSVADRFEPSNYEDALKNWFNDDSFQEYIKVDLNNREIVIDIDAGSIIDEILRAIERISKEDD